MSPESMPGARDALDHHNWIVTQFGPRKGPNGEERPQACVLEALVKPAIGQPFSTRLVTCEWELDHYQRFFVRAARLSHLWITIQDGDAAAASIVQHHFPDAKRCGGGAGLWTFLLPNHDGSVPEGSLSEGKANTCKRLQYLTGAQWVQVAPTMLYIWYGGKEVVMHSLEENFHVAMAWEQTPTLAQVREAEGRMQAGVGWGPLPGKRPQERSQVVGFPVVWRCTQ
jgi:hypothetical protein